MRHSPLSHPPRGLSALLLLVTLFVLGGPGARAQSGVVTVTPTPIPLSAPEVVNPLRGYFRWHGEEPVPQPQPSLDHYARLGWRELEPERGQYDFSKLERAMEAARSTGAKFAFRVMAVNEFTSPLEVPDYMPAETGGAWCTFEGKSVWVPDWDSPAFLARARALMQALGARFDGDPRLGYYDMGLYGHWGEWHTNDLCTPPATSATKHALVDLQLDAFSKTRVLMNNGGADPDAFIYALGRSPRIGIRDDSLCDPWFDYHYEGDPAKLAVMQDRWKTAPLVAEFYSWGKLDVARCEQQVRKWHVAAVANGMLHWDQYGAAEQATLVQIGKHAGYRFVLDRLAFPAEVTTNTPFTVSAEWSNLGITPAYEPVVIAFELRPQGQTQLAWSGRSQLNLEALLPTSEPQAVADTLRLPERLPPGVYTLSLALLDPSGYRPPLALAIQGRDATGRYPLGTLTVREGPQGYAAFLPALRSH